MQIERVFADYQLEASISGGYIRQQSIQYNLQTHLALGREKLQILKHELKRVLGVDVSLIQKENGQWQLHVPQEKQSIVSLLDLWEMLLDKPTLTAILGVTEDEYPLLLSFNDGVVSHILLSGDVGAGKTTLLRSIAISLALSSRQSQLQLVVVGHVQKGAYTILEPLNYLPHMLNSVVYDLTEVAQLLSFLSDELDHRQRQQINRPVIVIIVDDCMSLWEEQSEAIQMALTRLIQWGAKAGIHLIMSTDQPDKRILSALLKSHFSIRLVGQIEDEIRARAGSGLPDSQAQFLLGGGDFLAIADEEVIRFQATIISDYDLHLCLAELHRQRQPAILAQPFSIRPSLPMGEGVEIIKEQKFRFNGYSILLDEENKET